MRRLLPILIALTLSTGCTVMDELDTARAKMPVTENSKGQAAAEASNVSAEAAPAANVLLEQSREWWGRATSISSENMAPTIVRCRISGASQFMSKDECLARGGRPEGVSG